MVLPRRKDGARFTFIDNVTEVVALEYAQLENQKYEAHAVPRQSILFG